MSDAERPRFVPLSGFVDRDDDSLLSEAESFRMITERRRTVRHFSDRAVPRAVIEQCLLAAGSAPSGAHRQPWHFVAVGDPAVKHEIRRAAEVEEHELYHRRATREWLDALEPLGTDEYKPFLEIAPWLIAVFAERWGVGAEGGKIRNYYVTESVGIATGLLITALHHAGLATLTHTPSPMGFLTQILERPENERAFMLIVAGHPAADARVPDLRRKTLDEIATFR